MTTPRKDLISPLTGAHVERPTFARHCRQVEVEDAAGRLRRILEEGTHLPLTLRTSLAEALRVAEALR